MGKIYEALERAQRERKGIEKLPPVPMPEESFSNNLEISTEMEMLVLFKNIDTLLHSSQQKVIQFLGAEEGEGTSSITRDFARISANILGKSVFLLGSKNNDRDGLRSINFTSVGIEEEYFNHEKIIEEKISSIDDSKMSVCLISQQFVLDRKIIYSDKLNRVWENLKRKFDLVLIDSPPATKSPDGIAISSSVDGVVLVLEADKTRWPVSEKVKNQIIQNGGNILGIVLNKRRYYIPEYIYKRI